MVFHGADLKIPEMEKLKENRHLLSKVNKGIEPIFVLFMMVEPKKVKRK